MIATPYVWALRGAGCLALGLGLFLAVRGRGSATLGFVPIGPALVLGAWRTIQVRHMPLAGLHETLLTFGVCQVLVSAAACLRPRAWRVHGACLAFSGALWILASLASPRPTPLVPALQTRWFEIHVASSFFSYACFGLSAAASGFHLSTSGQGTEGLILRRANAWGFAGFTWAMVSGGIWAYLAWGTYWLWHVKELWSGILWTYYAGVVHLPHMPQWRGRREAALSIAGFGLVLFTYLGVGILMRNTHQF